MDDATNANAHSDLATDNLWYIWLADDLYLMMAGKETDP